MGCTTPPTGLLLIGHGTRDADGQREFHELADRVARSRPEIPVEACSLELAAPDIPEGLRRLVARGVERCVAVPALLFAGNHVQHDIPSAVGQAAASWPQVEWCLADHLGCQSELLALSAERFFQARPLPGYRGSNPPGQSMVVMIGRGGGDRSARNEMHQFVRARLELTPVDRAVTCFLAGSGPMLDEGLQLAAETPDVTQVVVQPHLLLAGRLVTQVAELVANWALRHPDRQWRLAAHLGPADQVIATILKNYQARVDIATPADSA